MEQIYEEYVRLCHQLCLQHEYNDMRNIRRHNKAMDQISALEEQIVQKKCPQILLKLMKHEDERVRLSAASACIRIKYHEEYAVNILIKISKESSDQSLAFSAHMVLVNCTEIKIQVRNVDS